MDNVIAPITEKTPQILVTRPFCGLCHMQVCVKGEATDEDILRVCNRENPSGTVAGWRVVIHETIGGIAGPGPCADDPTRTHFLVGC
jgi:hypothetical protein